MFKTRKNLTRVVPAAVAGALLLTLGAPGMAAARPPAQSAVQADANAANGHATNERRYSFGHTERAGRLVIGARDGRAANADPRFSFAGPTRRARSSTAETYAVNSRITARHAAPGDGDALGTMTEHRLR